MARCAGSALKEAGTKDTKNMKGESHKMTKGLSVFKH